MHYGFLNVFKCIIYFLYYFETYLNAWLIYKKTPHTNTTNNFNIILICESHNHVKKRLVMHGMAFKNENAPSAIMWSRPNLGACRPPSLRYSLA